MKYELIPGDSWLWWPVLVTSRRKHVKLVYTGCKSCDDFGELMLRSMLQVDAEIIMDRSWTIRDEIGVQKPSSSLHVFMLGVLHGLTRPEANAQLVVFSGNGRAMLWTWLTQIDASLLLVLSASILRSNGSVEAGQQAAILSVR